MSIFTKLRTIALALAFLPVLFLPGFFTPTPKPIESVVYVDVGMGHGSGVYIGNGLVITAAHVPEGSTGPITVKIPNGEYSLAEVVWSDSHRDVALLRLLKTPEALKPASFSCAEAEPLAPGTEVFKIGNPKSYWWVYGFGRVASDERAIAYFPKAMFVQITVLPGDSGGPVFDNDWNLVGIVNAFVSPNGMFSSLAIIVTRSAICEAISEHAVTS